MGGGKKMLEPVLDPLHRPIEFDRDPRKQHLLGIKHHDLRAKAAADEWRDDADLAFVEAEHAGETVSDEQLRLGSVPDRHLVGAAIPLRHYAPGLDRRRDAMLVMEAALDDAVGLGGSGGVAAFDLTHMRGNV